VNQYNTLLAIDYLLLTGVVLIALPVVLFFAGIAYQQVSQRRDLTRYPAPGKITASGLHVHCIGNGTPTVILEAGIAASSVSWSRVQPELAAFTRACAYDRRGLAWSRRPGAALSPEGLVGDLDEIVRQAGGGERCILVGHSFGGLLVRLYASRYPEKTAGLVVVDPAFLLEWTDPSPHRLRMLARGVALSHRGALLCHIGFVRLALAMLSGGARKIPKLFARLSSGRGASVTERLVGEVRKLPPGLWPAIQSHWSRAASFDSMAQHLSMLPELARAARNASPIPEIPLVVLSSAALSPEQLAEHEELAASCRHSEHIIADGCGHWIHLDAPELVVSAVRRMVEAARRSYR
jgi:pimeloyl-ACP methyl ester carboxylesterase